jgi:hypothetical protein
VHASWPSAGDGQRALDDLLHVAAARDFALDDAAEGAVLREKVRVRVEEVERLRLELGAPAHRREERRREPGVVVVEQGDEELVLAPEVVVDQRLVDAGAIRDVPRGRGVEAEVPEELVRRCEDPGPGFFRFHAQPPCWAYGLGDRPIPVKSPLDLG